MILLDYDSQQCLINFSWESESTDASDMNVCAMFSLTVAYYTVCHVILVSVVVCNCYTVRFRQKYNAKFAVFVART